jgi:prolipoprotein diacylglyceryltransferase
VHSTRQEKEIHPSPKQDSPFPRDLCEFGPDAHAPICIGGFPQITQNRKVVISSSIHVGPLSVNLYTLLIALAALGVTGWAWLRTRDPRVFILALVTAAVALAFGRSGYVALNWAAFREQPGEILSLTGVSEHAAIVGGLVALVGLAMAEARASNGEARLSGPSMVRVLSSALFLVAIAASIGCIPNGCAYGREVFWQIDGEASLAWLLRADWPDAALVNNPRWPTQLLMVGGLAVAWGVVLMVGGSGQLAGPRISALLPLGLLAFAITDFLVQFLRGDAALIMAGLRVYQWFDLVLAAAALALLAALAVHTRRKM